MKGTVVGLAVSIGVVVAGVWVYNRFFNKG